MAMKSSPLDISAFHQETSVKYPTFAPIVPKPSPAEPTKPAMQPDKLAAAYSPIPVRHHYHHDEMDQQQQGHLTQQQYQQQQQQQQQQGQGQQGQYRTNQQPATPAPTPPPSPKPKKQQYQTDQTRPFLFPYSARSKYRDGRLVPFAIDEADKLFHKHIYVSAALWQMWRTREDCMTAESGLDHMPGSPSPDVPAPEPAKPSVDVSSCSVLCGSIAHGCSRTPTRENLCWISRCWMRRSLKPLSPWRKRRPTTSAAWQKRERKISCA